MRTKFIRFCEKNKLQSCFKMFSFQKMDIWEQPYYKTIVWQEINNLAFNFYYWIVFGFVLSDATSENYIFSFLFNVRSISFLFSTKYGRRSQIFVVLVFVIKGLLCYHETKTMSRCQSHSSREGRGGVWTWVHFLVIKKKERK